MAKIKRRSWVPLSECCVSKNQGNSYSCPYHPIHVAIIKSDDLDWLVLYERKTQAGIVLLNQSTACSNAPSYPALTSGIDMTGREAKP